jgi:hypothetical protein
MDKKLCQVSKNNHSLLTTVSCAPFTLTSTVSSYFRNTRSGGLRFFPWPRLVHLQELGTSKVRHPV